VLPGGFGVHHHGGVRVGKVIRYYFDKGLQDVVADVIDTYGGVHTQCRVMTLGGGNSENFEIVPPAVDDAEEDEHVTGEVLLALGDGVCPHPFVLGTIYRSAIGNELQTDAGDADGVDADYSNRSSVQDRITKAHGIRMVFAKSGSWLLDVAKNEQPVRFQIYPTMFMRISHTDLQGYEPDTNEFVPLATALLRHIRGIHKRLDKLAEEIRDQGTELEKLSAHTHTIPSGNTGTSAVVTGRDPTYDVFNNYPFDFSYDHFLEPDSTETNYDGGSDDLKAGIFRISSLSYGDQQDL